MSIKRVFKSWIPSVNYVTQRGRTCSFIEGRFLTDHLEEIAELTQMVNDKSNPHIYIDPNEQEIDTTLQDRIRAAQVEATQRILAEEAERKAAEASGTPTSAITQDAPQTGQPNVSMSPAALLGVTTSATLGALSAQSNQK